MDGSTGIDRQTVGGGVCDLLVSVSLYTMAPIKYELLVYDHLLVNGLYQRTNQTASGRLSCYNQHTELKYNLDLSDNTIYKNISSHN